MRVTLNAFSTIFLRATLTCQYLRGGVTELKPGSKNSVRAKVNNLPRITNLKYLFFLPTV